jgi:hypothetical protein
LIYLVMWGLTFFIIPVLAVYTNLNPTQARLITIFRTFVPHIQPVPRL